MNSRLLLIIAVALTVAGLSFAQSQAPKPPLKPEEIVRLWFERWNALDGSEEAGSRLLELYHPDAYHQTSPNEKQMGQVRYHGHDAIKKMVTDFTAANHELNFRIQAVSANEKSGDLIHTAEGPWGGPSAAVEYAAAYTTRKDTRRWMHPGAAFFQIQDGKIRGARFYMARDELMEVFNR